MLEKIRLKLLDILGGVDRKSVSENYEKICQPKFLVQLLLDREIQWYDYSNLEKQRQHAYYQQAQQLLENEVFNNGLDFLKKNEAFWLLAEADNQDDINKSRWFVSALELFRERIKEINSPYQNDPNTDLDDEDKYSSL